MRPASRSAQLFLACLVAWGLVAPAAARAGDNPVCVVYGNSDWPPDGAIDVPLNTLLVFTVTQPWEPYSLPSELTLEDASGIAVPTDVTTEVYSYYACDFIRRPIQLLAPITDYLVRGSPERPLYSTFTTGSEVWTTPPTLELAIPKSNGTYPEAIAVTRNEGAVLVIFGLGGQTNYTVSGIGEALEFPSLTYRLNQDRDVTLFVYDGAGNETKVVIPGHGFSVGCQASGAEGAGGSSGSEGGWMLGLGLLVWLLVRTHARHRTRR